MNREYHLIYTESILTKATYEYFKKVIGIIFPVVYLLLAAFTVYRLAAGDRSWVVGVSGAAIVFIGVLLFSLFIAQIKSAKSNFLSMQGGTCTLVLSETGLRFATPLGIAEIPWVRIKEVKVFTDFVLILFEKSGYTSIPLASIDIEGLEYLKHAVS